MNCIHLYNFRNFHSAKLTLSRINLIYGDNASGKTSLLESIYLSSYFKSFRTNNLDDLIQDNGYFFKADYKYKDNIISLIKQKQETLIIKNNGLNIKNQDCFLLLPAIKILSPHINNFLVAGSEFRRKNLDWLCCYLNDDFLKTYNAYKKALINRNATLKSGKLKDDDFWIQLLSIYGNRLNKIREQAVLTWQTKILELWQIFNFPAIEIKFNKGWQGALIEEIHFNKANDLKKKYTGVGPHRADIGIFTKNTHKKAEFYLPRSQIKLFDLIAVLAQLILLDETGKDTILLIDDFEAELDDNSKKMLELLTEFSKTKFIISTINKLDCNLTKVFKDFHQFYLEQNKIK